MLVFCTMKYTCIHWADWYKDTVVLAWLKRAIIFQEIKDNCKFCTWCYHHHYSSNWTTIQLVMTMYCMVSLMPTTACPHKAGNWSPRPRPPLLASYLNLLKALSLLCTWNYLYIFYIWENPSLNIKCLISHNEMALLWCIMKEEILNI